MKKILLVSAIIFTWLFTPCKAQQSPFYDFDSLSAGMTSPGGRVLALAVPDSDTRFSVFAGGHFTIAGKQPAMNIAQWLYDGNGFNFGIPPQGKWVALGSGINNDVCALALFDSNLYAGGKFDTASGIAASHIARWDTATQKWDSLVGQLNGTVYALCVYHNALYVGGNFTIANGDTVNRIAAWNGSAWSPVGKGFDTGAVYALTVSNDTLYAGGSFIKSGQAKVNHIAKLSGSLWKALGVGTNNTVYALTDYDDELWAGGAFTTSGGISTPYISYYDDYFSFKWSPWGIEAAVNDTVRALCSGFYPAVTIKKSHPGHYQGDMLLIGGNFDTANGLPAKYFVTDMFSDTTSKLSGPVFALASQWVAENYAGGEFKSVRNYSDAGRFTEPLNNITVLTFHDMGGGVESLSNQANIIVYPNPSSGVFTVSFSHPELVSGTQTIEIYNVLGAKVYSAMLNQVQHDYELNLSAQPSGIYLCRIIGTTGNLIGQGKIVIEK